DELALAGKRRTEKRAELGPVGVARLQGVAAAVEPEDERCAGEGAEHDGEATVFGEVGGGFVAAAGGVEIADAFRAEDAKGVHALGREIYAAGGGRARDEEKFLFGDEAPVSGRELGEEFRHPFRASVRGSGGALR